MIALGNLEPVVDPYKKAAKIDENSPPSRRSTTNDGSTDLELNDRTTMKKNTDKLAATSDALEISLV